MYHSTVIYYEQNVLDFHKCEDYESKGINVTGSYYMYVNGGSVLESVYCDFERMRYRKCDDYLADNITESGEYLIYLNSRLHKVYCDFSTGKYDSLTFWLI